MSIGGFSSNADRSARPAIPKEISKGFDPQRGTESISEDNLKRISKEIFWNAMMQQGAKTLVINCEGGRTVTYEKGYFNRLLKGEPDLADLTESFTLKFAEGGEVQETKAKLIMCGDLFGAILNSKTDEAETHRILLRKVPQNDFEEVLEAIETEVVDLSVYDKKDVKYTMDFLGFHPVGVPEGVHGQKDWNSRGVDVGQVPRPPKELLEALKEPCPHTKDGSLTIDTHVILCMPQTLNGEPNSVDNLEKMAKSEAFGDNKIEYSYIYEPIRSDAAINQQLERGYWLLLCKKPVAGGQSFAAQKQYIAENCPGYQVPKAREVIACSFMQYGCSEERKERILAEENDVCYSRCEEQINGMQVVVGALDSSGLDVDYNYAVAGAYVGVCPVRRFF